MSFVKNKFTIIGFLLLIGTYSLEAQNLKNMWMYNKKKEKCIQTIEKLDKEDKENVFQTLQNLVLLLNLLKCLIAIFMLIPATVSLL